MGAADNVNRMQLYRGEIRNIYPSPEYPDVAHAAEHDPQGLMENWIASGRHAQKPGVTGPGHNEEYAHEHGREIPDIRGDELTTGVHWSRSPQTIPQRFIEPLMGSGPRGENPQPGAPMPKREANQIQSRETEHEWEELLYHKTGGRGSERWQQELTGEPMPQEYTKALARNAREYNAPEEKQYYRDLTGSGHVSKPYRAGVVWHGHIDPNDIDPDNPPTDYEEEVNVRPGADIHISAARLWVPKPGETPLLHRDHPLETHPTPEMVMKVGGHRWTGSGYNVVKPEGIVPWKVVQFPQMRSLKVAKYPRGYQ